MWSPYTCTLDSFSDWFCTYFFSLIKVENDDGIWLKLSKDSVKKYCDAEVESWTLAVAVSGRVYLAQDGDTTYQSQVIDTATPPAPTQPAFPTAASVFGTPPQKSVFGTPIVPSPPTFQFGTLKLQFGNTLPQPPALPFKFGSVKKKEDTKKAVEKSTEDKKTKVDQAKPARRKVLLFAGRARNARRKLRSAVVETSKVPSSKTEEEEEEEEEEKEDKAINFEAEEVPLPPPDPPIKKALSPAVAECQRAVYAAFLWQEGLVYDAIVSATYLKFHPKLSKEMKREQKTEKEEKAAAVKEKKEEGEPAKDSKGSQEVEGESKEDSGEQEKEVGEKVKSSSGLVLSMEADPQPGPSSLPPTLNHLVTFWDEISTRVLDNSSIAFPPPKVPPLAQELQKRYEDEKKEIDKRKKEKDKKVSPQAGGGSTVCELCEQSFPDPVTYHMKDIHPGCGKHASGWGYNSRGTFCSGWAGNCGDGGRGGSTWYLMCKDCHTKYLAMKNEVKKKTLRPAPLPKMKTKKPGKARCLPVISAVQGMIQNAKFLLEVSCPTDNKPATTPTAILSPTLSKQSSIPCSSKADQETNPASSSEGVLPDRPALLRSTSVLAPQSPLLATKSKVLRPQRILSSSTEDDAHVVHQQSMDSPIFTSDETSTGLVFKPSINLARLMYSRSMHSADSKEVGYGKVMAFVLQYHDLNGLRMAMKQSMRVAGIRAFAMEVSNCYCVFLYLYL